MKSTKDQILDIAEKHFAIYGFAGTSLRGIIKDAKTNVASVAYHFGTKEDLFQAVMERFAKPVVSQQLARLEAELESKDIDLRNVLLAFYEPPVRLAHNLGKKGETLSLFLGRSQTEPEPLFSLVDKHYKFCRDQFISAFKQAVPGLTDEDYHWRFEFMLSLIVCFLTRQKQIRSRYETKSDWDPDEAIARMIAFCESGF